MIICYVVRCCSKESEPSNDFKILCVSKSLRRRFKLLPIYYKRDNPRPVDEPPDAGEQTHHRERTMDTYAS